MSYLALYRKYRPNSFDSVYGQEKIVKVIENEIINNKVSHAYLFSGPRGTGKTTTAKIIARLVNCDNLQDGKACGKCYNCLNFNSSNDIIEIDAASNNGVDEIRELRDKINLVPSNAKYKVYIIDEVHMLTTQAFNALLKTLEEPPKHVIFILATTEPHKIPLTIASRCQKFQFSKIDDEKIKDRLSEISKNEKIEIADEALYEIARLSDGCMRDAINLLDQITAYSNGKILLDDVYKVNGSVSYDYLYNLFLDIKNSNKNNIINCVDKLDFEGKNIDKFIEEMIIFLKDIIVYKNTNILTNIGSKNEKILLLCDLCDDNYLYSLINELNETSKKIKFSSHQSIILLISLLKFIDSNKLNNNKIVSVENETKNVEKNESSLQVGDDKIISREIILEVGLSLNNIKIRINNSLATASKDMLKIIKNEWKKLDDFIVDNNHSVVAGLLKDCQPIVASEQYIMVQSDLISTVDRINQNYESCQQLLKKMFNNDFKIVAITNVDWQKEKNQYIKNVKNGVKYSIIKEEESYKEENIDTKKTPVDELVEIVGENVIEYR